MAEIVLEKIRAFLDRTQHHGPVADIDAVVFGDITVSDLRAVVAARDADREPVYPLAGRTFHLTISHEGQWVLVDEARGLAAQGSTVPEVFRAFGQALVGEIAAALDKKQTDRCDLPRVTAADLRAAVARGENVSAYVPLILDKLEASSEMEDDLLDLIGEMVAPDQSPATDSPDRPEQSEPGLSDGPMESVAGADAGGLRVGDRVTHSVNVTEAGTITAVNADPTYRIKWDGGHEAHGYRAANLRRVTP